MDALRSAVERLKRLPEEQARGAAREIGACLAGGGYHPFVPGRNVEQLADLIEGIRDDYRLIMTDLVRGLADCFERANHVRATQSPHYVKSHYNLEKLRIPDWPVFEYSEVVENYVLRTVSRQRSGTLLKDSVDCSWREGFVTLKETPPSAESMGELAEVELVSRDEFEVLWAEAAFVGKEGDQAWEVMDTTGPADPSFEPVLGAWRSAGAPSETMEFTLNGIVLWTRPNEAIQFYRYSVDGREVLLDPETGNPRLKFVLEGDVLLDDTGRRFLPE